jgi:hypothetical protein
MDFSEDDLQEGNELGSDELLSDDFLRLPENANVLVRIHAVQAWLNRRLKETELEIGEAALAIQEAEMTTPALRRREREQQHTQQQHLYLQYEQAQERLRGFQDAANLLEENIDHVTSSERTLVEYYLSLEELRQSANEEQVPLTLPWHMALAEVQHRIEHVGIPDEE